MLMLEMSKKRRGQLLNASVALRANLIEFLGVLYSPPGAPHSVPRKSVQKYTVLTQKVTPRDFR